MTDLIPRDAAIAAITLGHTVTQHEKSLRAIPAIDPAQMMVLALRDAGYDTPTDPRDAVIARLVEALEMMRSTYPYNPPCYGWQEQVEAHKAAKAAIAAAKAVQHG